MISTPSEAYITEGVKITTVAFKTSESVNCLSMEISSLSMGLFWFVAANPVNGNNAEANPALAAPLKGPFW